MNAPPQVIVQKRLCRIGKVPEVARCVPLTKRSATMFELLGLTLGRYDDAPLVPDAPTSKERKVDAPVRIA